MRIAIARGLTAAFLLLLLVGPAVQADEDIAELLFTKAEKAARGKRYEEAAGLYERALKEHSPYPEAAFGLAVALEKQGKTQEALRAFLRCRDDLAALKRPTRRQRSLGKKADRAIQKLGAGYAELDDLDAQLVKDLLAFARRYRRSDPAWAKRALETVLAIDPGNKTASDELGRLGAVSGPADAERPFSPAISAGMHDWHPGPKDDWSLTGDLLTCDTSGPGQLNFYKPRLEGSYSFRASFRLKGTKGSKRVFGFFFGDKGSEKSDWALIFNWAGELDLARTTEQGRHRAHSKILPSWKYDRWHTIQVDVKPGAVVCSLDGKRVFDVDGEAKDAFDGNVALYVQDAHVEIRNVEVRR
jgi:tetratricopeptide (TPR) repeat protein